jgi:hypothetical protein
MKCPLDVQLDTQVRQSGVKGSFGLPARQISSIRSPHRGNVDCGLGPGPHHASSAVVSSGSSRHTNGDFRTRTLMTQPGSHPSLMGAGSDKCRCPKRDSSGSDAVTPCNTMYFVTGCSYEIGPGTIAGGGMTDTGMLSGKVALVTGASAVSGQRRLRPRGRDRRARRPHRERVEGRRRGHPRRLLCGHRSRRSGEYRAADPRRAFR